MLGVFNCAEVFAVLMEISSGNAFVAAVFLFMLIMVTTADVRLFLWCDLIGFVHAAHQDS